MRKAGGNASATSVKYSIGLPTKWIKAIHADESSYVELIFDGESIKIQKYTEDGKGTNEK